jgi:hypothetical protein
MLPKSAKGRFPVNFVIKVLLIIFILSGLAGCAGEPQKSAMWLDATGNNRDENALAQDKASCNVDRQQAIFRASQMYPGGAGYCSSCGQLNAGSAMLQQQNIDIYADKAFTNCMEAAGWRKKQ